MRSTLNNLPEINLPEAEQCGCIPMNRSLREVLLCPQALLNTNIQNMLGKKSRTVKMVGRRAIRTLLIK
jgi:hypothetical protein